MHYYWQVGKCGLGDIILGGWIPNSIIILKNNYQSVSINLGSSYWISWFCPILYPLNSVSVHYALHSSQEIYTLDIIWFNNYWTDMYYALAASYTDEYAYISCRQAITKLLAKNKSIYN